MRRVPDDATEKSLLAGSAHGWGPTEVPALTIVWHPELSRVGEICPLPMTPEAPIDLCRLTPVFAGPGTAGKDQGGRGLEHKHLSRSTPSVRFALDPRGPLQVLPGNSEIPTELDGVPLERPTPITAAELQSGVILLVARRIVLCLHKVQLPMVRGPQLGLVGGGDGIERVRQLIRRVADLDVPVLVRGETGTGKEMVARALVESGARADRPLVSVNMAAVSATTATAELFGHEKGAFTGAVAARGGYFGDASGGTLFMDEVGLTPPALQPMLLRVLETGEVLPVGATRGKKVDVRLISATDAQLESQIADRSFSEPLFHRLAGFQIVLPPLRERREDFGALLLHFLKRELAATGELSRLEPQADGKTWLSASQVAQLASGSWPGNVRALRNAVRQIVIAGRGEARARIDEGIERLMDHREGGELRSRPRSSASEENPMIPSGAQPRVPSGELRAPVAPSSPTRSTFDISAAELLQALRNNRWSPHATAAALQIPRTTLYALMDKHPGIRKASEIPSDELLSQYQACGGDLDRLADRLQVSRRGLQLRLAQLVP